MIKTDDRWPRSARLDEKGGVDFRCGLFAAFPRGFQEYSATRCSNTRRAQDLGRSRKCRGTVLGVAEKRALPKRYSKAFAILLRMPSAGSILRRAPDMPKSLQKYFAFFRAAHAVAFAIAFVIPFIMGVYLSFTEFTTVTNAHWVGVSNYSKAFANDEFFNALWFTAKFAVVSVVTINVLAFAVALLLTRGIKGTNVFRTVFFMPNIIGGIVMG
jgi:hypothetical protein